MRYEKGYKEATRKRILKIAAKRFKKDGIDAVGLAGLMKDAGLTHGGFYNHFKSKEELVAQSLIMALDEALDLWEKESPPDTDAFFDHLLSFYLSSKHCAAPDRGCALASLGSEITKRPDSTKKLLGEKALRFFDIIAKHLPEQIKEEKKMQIAMAVFSTMVGAVQLARLMPDKTKQDQVLQSAAKSALAMIPSV